MTIRFITATRDSLEAFGKNALLSQSLARVSCFSKIELQVAAQNSNPLPTVFNHAIEEADPDDVLVFIHDDVWIDDWMIEYRLLEGLLVFDVLCIAGNTRRFDRQENWILNKNREHDVGHLSGAISHGQPLNGNISRFGESPAPVCLMDGVLLAARAGTLVQAGVRFDPRFPFHYYDTDFSRSCDQAGLRMGTWPIAITHGSPGVWGHEPWEAAFALYLKKWGS